MTRHSKTRTRCAIGVLLLCTAAVGSPRAQARPTPTELRDQLSARYEIVALQDGVGLIPRQRGSKVRMVEIRNGAVAVDGATLTGSELRDRLGADADLILRATYLDASAQRELAGVTPSDQAPPAASPAPPVPPAAPPAESETPDSPSDRADRVRRRGDQARRGDFVRVGGNIDVAVEEVIQGDIVAIAGSATVNGHVTGDAVVVGGSLTLGPEAEIEGDVSVVGGSLTRAPGSRIGGSINDFAADGAFDVPGMIFGSFWQRVGGLAATLLRVTLLVLVGWVAVAVGRPSLERIGARSAADPVKSGLAGLLAELLFIPLLVVTVVVLAVSLIGIPLLVLVPFGIVLFLLLLVVGFTAVAFQVGRTIFDRVGWTERGAYAAVAIGVLVITAVTIAARLAALAGGFIFGGPVSAIGYLVEYVAWTVGLGATIVAWYGSRSAIRSPVAPPPLPTE